MTGPLTVCLSSVARRESALLRWRMWWEPFKSSDPQEKRWAWLLVILFSLMYSFYHVHQLYVSKGMELDCGVMTSLLILHVWCYSLLILHVWCYSLLILLILHVWCYSFLILLILHVWCYSLHLGQLTICTVRSLLVIEFLFHANLIALKCTYHVNWTHSWWQSYKFTF